jgi:hypothetical protein
MARWDLHFGEPEGKISSRGRDFVSRVLALGRHLDPILDNWGKPLVRPLRMPSLCGHG